MVAGRCDGSAIAAAIQQLTSLERYCRAAGSEGVLKADEEIGKYQSSGKTTYGTFINISKHELR
jgi:hypothetical protein